MEEIFFEKMNQENEALVRELTIKSNQMDFIETVDECLAEAEANSLWNPLAIYYNGKVIGFSMHGSLGPGGYLWLDRLLIDHKYQGLGLGKLAMKALMKKVLKEYDVKLFYLSIVPENEVAYGLYTRLGFAYTNEKYPNGELIFKYEVNNDSEVTIN